MIGRFKYEHLLFMQNLNEEKIHQSIYEIILRGAKTQN